MFHGVRIRLIFYLMAVGVAVAEGTLSLLTARYGIAVACVVVGMWAIFGIFRLYKKNYDKTLFMLNAISNGDYSFHFSEKGRTTDDLLLNATLNNVRDILGREKEYITAKESYYRLILDNISTGILVFNRFGGIYQLNRATLSILGIPLLTHLNQLSTLDPEFPELFGKLRPGERRNISVQSEKVTTSLLLRCSDVLIENEALKIVTLQEIGGELDEKELDSWIKLIRVLTHEIMNTVTPITSLSATLAQSAGTEDPEMAEGLEVIRSMGDGLMKFVNSYRELTRIPNPDFTIVPVRGFLTNLIRIRDQPDVAIRLEVTPEDMTLFADESLLFQAVRNLIKNAEEATRGMDRREISIRAYSEVGRSVIEVCDNGPGVPSDVEDHIFVPFFTTKESGSGIGLSVVKQIMRVHQGNVAFTRKEGRSCFRLSFRA